MKNISTFLKQLQRNLGQNLQAMSSAAAQNGRSSTPPRPDRRPLDLEDESLKHSSQFASLAREANKQLCDVKPVEIKVSWTDTVKSVAGILHTPENFGRERLEGCEKMATILLSGAFGGVVGPSSIYVSIAEKLASLSRGVPVLRLDYRYPARNSYCVSDVLAAMDYMRNGYAVSQFVLVGWSYGGAPVFTVGGQSDRVVGCATIASQTAETQGISQVARKGIPVLLLHGTADQRLSASCSESLRDRYKRHSSGGDVQLKLFDGDDHSLSNNSLQAEELLCDFIMKQTGNEIGKMEQKDVVQRPLLGEQEKVEKMKKGGDLYGESDE